MRSPAPAPGRRSAQRLCGHAAIPVLLIVASSIIGSSEAPANRGPRQTRAPAPEVERLSGEMARQPAHRQLVYQVSPEAGERVVEELLKHPRFEFKGGFRRASLDGRQNRAIFRTRDPQSDKLELLRRLSWRNHRVDLWTPGGGTIYFGGTSAGPEMAILRRDDGRYTFLLGDSNSVGGFAMEAKYGSMLLHTHPGVEVARQISAQDIRVFGAAAAGMSSREIVLGRNLHLIASYPSSKKDRPAAWFRHLDVYLFASDLPPDTVLRSGHPIHREVMRVLGENGFRRFLRPRGIVVNPTDSSSTELVAR